MKREAWESPISVYRLTDPETGEVVAVDGFVHLLSNTFTMEKGKVACCYKAMLFADAVRLIEKTLGCVPKRLYYHAVADMAVAYSSPPPFPTLKGAILENRTRRGKRVWVRHMLVIPKRIVNRWASLIGRTPPYLEITVVSARALEEGHASFIVQPERVVVILRPHVKLPTPIKIITITTDMSTLY